MAIPDVRAWQIDRLLLQREAEFARVHALEAAIEDRLGAPYPLPAPPKLPSQQRPRNAKPKRKAAKSVEADEPRWKVRPLRPGESAYEVRFRQARAVQKERHLDRTLLESLLNLPALRGRILLLQTMTNEGAAGDVLFQVSENPR